MPNESLFFQTNCRQNHPCLLIDFCLGGLLSDFSFFSADRICNQTPENFEIKYILIPNVILQIFSFGIPVFNMPKNANWICVYMLPREDPKYKEQGFCRPTDLILDI